jgi:hypothetical protein
MGPRSIWSRNKKELDMQVAKLYLRGNLVNYTNKNLNADQLLDRDKIFFAIDNDPKIIPSKSKFKQKLAETIGGEYCDPRAAEVEWWTATWRAILTATYHTPLEYRSYAPSLINNKKAKHKGTIYGGDNIGVVPGIDITICESLPIPPEHKILINANGKITEYYTNKRGLLVNPQDNTKFVVLRGDEIVLGPLSPGDGSHRTKFTGKFDPSIHNGDRLRIVQGPDLNTEVPIECMTSTSIIFNTPRPLILGSDLEIMEKVYKKVMADSYSTAQGEPQFYCHPSLRPIHMVIRSRRSNPEIIFDGKQMRKLVKNYGWEFIGQILKENKRDMIKTQTYIEDSAEIIAIKMVESLFRSSKESIRFEVAPGATMVRTETGLLTISMVQKIADLKREFLIYNVDIQVVDGEGIKIKIMGDTPIISRKIIEVRFNQDKSFDDKIDEESTVRDTLESQIAHKEKLVASFESMQSRDAMNELLCKLPDNAAKFMSILMSPPPDLFEKYGGSPRERDIAEYMGINPSQIKRFKETIRLQMLALGIGPDDELESQT